MRGFAGGGRKRFEHWRCEGGEFDIIETGAGEGENRPTDAIAPAVWHLAHIAEPDHGLDEMKRGGAVKAEPLAQFGEADAGAVAGDFLEDCESALDRLNAVALGFLFGGRGGIGHSVLTGSAEFNHISPSCKDSNNAG